MKKSLNALSHHCKTSSSLTNMTIRWHHFHWHIAWDCKKLSQNAHKEYIVFVNYHLLVTVSRVVTIAETFSIPSCFSPRSNSCVFSSLVVRLSWQWGGWLDESKFIRTLGRDDLRGKLALSNEKTEEEARWEETQDWTFHGIKWSSRPFLLALQKEIVSFCS